MKKICYIIISLLAILLLACKDRTYTITFHYNGKEKIETYYNYEDLSLVMFKPSITGYDFEGWFFDEELTKPFYQSQVDKPSFNLYALLKVHSMKITFDVQGGNYIAPIYVDYNQTVDTLPTAFKEGYEFIDWFLDTNGNQKFICGETTIKKDTTLYAIYMSLQYKVTYHSQYGNTPPAENQRTSSILDLPFLYDDEYNFLGWYLDSEFKKPFIYRIMPKEDIDLYAKWVKKTANDVVIKFESDYEVQIPNLVGPKNYEVDCLPQVVYNPSFQGWYYDKTFLNAFSYGTSFNKAILSNSTTVYARVSSQTKYLFKVDQTTPLNVDKQIDFFTVFAEDIVLRTAGAYQDIFQGSTHAVYFNYTSTLKFSIAGQAIVHFRIDEGYSFFDLFALDNTSRFELITTLYDEKTGIATLNLEGGNYILRTRIPAYLYQAQIVIA